MSGAMASWRCLLCGATGDDGLTGWQEHYDDEHHEDV